ncbi:MAG TPA: hypothetical protein VNQ90_15520 [Chthoniobacteraceae bacterium]|nr:hypothetical protein [Chthoniobacteraceae bacterium]
MSEDDAPKAPPVTRLHQFKVGIAKQRRDEYGDVLAACNRWLDQRGILNNLPKNNNWLFERGKNSKRLPKRGD